MGLETLIPYHPSWDPGLHMKEKAVAVSCLARVMKLLVLQFLLTRKPPKKMCRLETKQEFL